MKTFIRIFSWLWQFPQNIIGLVIVSVLHAKRHTYNGIAYYDGKLKGGVSLGDYIILDRRYYPESPTVAHEHGHQLQSLYLGWLYLIVIGIPSGIGNLVFRIPAVKARWSYYSQPWEAWADRLGGVER